jgi:hypothetical protein
VWFAPSGVGPPPVAQVTRLSETGVRCDAMVESEIADQLEALAAEHEEQARQLRQAAAIVRQSSAGASTMPPASSRADSTDGEGEVAGAKPTGDNYRDTIRAEPNTIWQPAALALAMRSAGFSVKDEAARTMLYRLEKQGVVEKHGRGTWRAVPLSTSVSQSGLEGENVPPADEEAPV